MRRGHPNVGGWRSENHRHFRPRNAGTPHFRPSRPFGQSDILRFMTPNRQYRGIRPYNSLPGHTDARSEQRDRNPYRLNNVPRQHERDTYNRDRQHQNRDIPTFNRQSHRDIDHGAKYSDSKFYKNADTYHVSMGDKDHRHHHQNKDAFSPQKISPWTNHPPQSEYNKQYYDDHRSAPKTPKRYNVCDEMLLPDYSGHRPPASDHYIATTSANNNNSQYTHSVDDTVDIIRKRLLNRDKQPSPESPVHHQSNVDEDLRQNTVESYQTPHRDQPVKKKIQRQKQNIKLNCDKIKNKIVHQLFKMDKAKIHKLMDNQSSSSKFEYAISTLITEGQNSLNKHMRSVAEKSLYSSSSDFIQDDSNTIYEDTFMKQMQGVLDPQDTVLLEDIKPMVMAELSRVLQLDDFQLEGIQDQGVAPKQEPGYSYIDEEYNSEQYGQDTFYEQNFQKGSSYDNTDSVADDNSRNKSYHEYDQQPSFGSKPLFERRPQKKLSPVEEHQTTENRVSNQSTDESFEYQQEKLNKPSPYEPLIPLFDPNTEQLSDEDDPFAELDNQYHVAVDHNFIESTSCAPSPQRPFDYNNEPPCILKHNKKLEVPCDIVPSINIKKDIEKHIRRASPAEIKNEINSKLQRMANSPVKLFPCEGSASETESAVKIYTDNEVGIEKEIHGIENMTHEESNKQDSNEAHKYDNAANTKSMLQPNSRKRSTDQKPSHRKEKRKKWSHSECEESKSIATMFYTNDDQKGSLKDNKIPVSTDKTYSNKYVKRKEPNKNKEKDSDALRIDESKKPNSNSSNHSVLSPKDSISHDTLNKTETKLTLKPIDMFVGQPKKALRPARRNTATTLHIAKSPDENKPTLLTPKAPLTTPTITSFSRKLTRRHVGTQIVKKFRNKECQTDKQKFFFKETQTNPISIDTSKSIASNPLERMKEIDMEIQLLLQEKFKLYNSIESSSKTDSIDSMPSLSMRIFQVNQTDQIDDKSVDSEDAIVDEFTSIPTEELEKIAMETYDVKIPKKVYKRSQRQKVMQLSRKSSQSPTSKQNKKAKAPNISLIEQIITDDRPIEDIISLDDLETTPIKAKRKVPRSVPKKKASKKLKPSKDSPYDCADLKPCCVVLERIDINQYLKHTEVAVNNNVELESEVQITDSLRYRTEQSNISEVLHEEPPELQSGEIVEETVINDLQFDMLDFSEDIIIGDNCEVKTEKVDERIITEDIILDNSQSSIEDGVPEACVVENECKIYDYSTNENLRRDAITVTGNADAVLAIECIENNFIAACLDGNVYHFNGDGLLLNTLRGSNLAVTCLTIVKEKYGTTVYTGSLDSRIRYYDLETGMEKGPECNVLSPIQTMDRAWDTVFVGTRTGFVLQFECKNNMLIPVSTVKFSEQSILALRALKEGPRKVLLVAARSENVTIKDAQTGLLLRTLCGPKMTVYTLLFEDGKVYCGTSSHNIHVFDYTSGVVVGRHEGGKGAVCVRACGGLVFAGCYDGCVYVFREGEPAPLAQLRGPSLMLLSLAIRGTNIIAGYKDRSLYIWKMPLAILQEMVL